MTAGWQTVTLGNVCHVDKHQGLNRGLPYVGLEHIESGTGRFIGLIEPLEVKSQTFRFSQEHVLYGRLRPYLNKVMLPDFDGHCSTEIFPIRPKPVLMREFLQYWLLRDETVEQINATTTGSRMPRANINAILDLEIPLPPLAEQRRIVGILDEALADLALAKANTEKSTLTAQSLFESYLLSIFSQRGEGWVDKRVSEIAKHSLGKMLDKAKNKGNLQPYLRNLNVRWFEFDLTDLAEMPFLPEEAEKYTAVKGDVLICEGGAYRGRAAIWSEDDPVYFQKALHRVRFHDPEYSKWFVYYLLATDQSGQLEKHLTGTGIPHFTGKALAKFVVPLAPKPQLRITVAKFDSLADNVKRLKSICQRKVLALEELKTSLLQLAFSGQL